MTCAAEPDPESLHQMFPAAARPVQFEGRQRVPDPWRESQLWRLSTSPLIRQPFCCDSRECYPQGLSEVIPSSAKRIGHSSSLVGHTSGPDASQHGRIMHIGDTPRTTALAISAEFLQPGFGSGCDKARSARVQPLWCGSIDRSYVRSDNILCT